MHLTRRWWSIIFRRIRMSFHAESTIEKGNRMTHPSCETTRVQPITMAAMVLLLISSLAWSGCATSPTAANTVRRGETGMAHTFERGEVIYVREVTIEGETQGLGAVAGGVMGLAVGNLVGGGRGRDLSRVTGTMAGAAAGTAIEQAVTTVAGVEVSILLESGELIVVIQAADEVFKPGDYVRVIRRADGGVRVVQ
jgi:outer membrane lipoprotein SlyB